MTFVQDNVGGPLVSRGNIKYIGCEKPWKHWSSQWRQYQSFQPEGRPRQQQHRQV